MEREKLKNWRGERRREKQKRRERGAPHLVLGVGAVGTLDDVLFDVPQVDGGREFTPLPAGLCSAPHPHWQVLVNEEGLWTGRNPIPRLSLPNLRPLEEDIVAWFVTIYRNKTQI